MVFGMPAKELAEKLQKVPMAERLIVKGCPEPTLKDVERWSLLRGFSNYRQQGMHL
jgi:hypothetical protein